MPYLNEENNLVFGNMQRATSFDLELKELLKDWDEGIGYDFNPNESRKPYDQAYSNDIPSSWIGMTDGTLGDVITTQHFDKGNEDIEMDITDFVNNIITGNTEYKGFCLKYTDEFENPTGITKFDKNEVYAFGLFTRHTQSFFEPFIESTYDDIIKDDRGDFYLNKTNRLYLYFSVDGKNENFDELPTCTIDGFTGVTLDVKQQSRGVYYVEVEVKVDEGEGEEGEEGEGEGEEEEEPDITKIKEVKEVKPVKEEDTRDRSDRDQSGRDQSDRDQTGEKKAPNTTEDPIGRLERTATPKKKSEGKRVSAIQHNYEGGSPLRLRERTTPPVDKGMISSLSNFLKKTQPEMKRELLRENQLTGSKSLMDETQILE
jgi:hypothetical protein